MDMEEFRPEALEFYNKSSNEVKALAKNFFNLIDSDGDSTIDVAEFAAFFVKEIKFISRYGHANLFESLDRNGDGSLDFNEFVTFFYVIFAACRCNGCQKRFMDQRRLTCRTCFATTSRTFDLCSTCFSSKNFVHQHSDFLDFKVLVFESSYEDVREPFIKPKMKPTTNDPCNHSGCSKCKKGAESSTKPKKGKKWKKMRMVLEGINITLEIINQVANCINLG